MIKLRCVVEHITYQNPENGWSVMRVNVKGYKDLVTLTGSLLDVPVGSVLLCEGDWRVDTRYGQQFVVQSWTEVMPATIYGIEKYLGSGLVKGIGPVFAKSIVSKFGTETLNVIDNEPDRLLEVPKLGKKRVERIKESWEKQKDIKEVMVFLQGYGVSTAFAAKIYRKYEKESIKKVKDNPYQLADDIWGIGFKTADGIASKMGYEKNDPRRCRSGILYTLNQLAEDGHVYAEQDQLVETATKLLEAEDVSVRDALASMIETKDVIVDNEVVYLPPFYYAEDGSAKRLSALLSNIDSNDYSIAAEPEMEYGTKTSGIVYDDVQQAAIQKALDSKFMVLTGGPGTGKTTTTQGIIEAFKARKKAILLAAPTGRAAKRMTEATGMEAKTFHRLLEYSPMDGYKRNEENRLEGDVLIVDECSMIDILLFYNLMKAIPEKMRLILVGDIDQLPSVGAGNVLRDIIDSNKIPVVRLTRIFRQAQTSRIVMNAHAINAGNFPNIQNGHETDFFFIKQENPDEIVKLIIVNVRENLDLVPASLELARAEIDMATKIAREGILKSLLEEHLDKYDYVLIDCPPSLGIVTTNALVASDELFIPLTAEALPLKGLTMLDDVVNEVRKRVNPKLEIGAVFFTRFNNRKLNKEVVTMVANRYGDKVLNTKIRENISLAEMPLSGQSIFEYDPKSNGATDYMALVNELIAKNRNR